MSENTNALWFEKVPKVELHLHLEGAIPPNALWTLVQKYGGDPTVPDLNYLVKKFTYKDFPHFLETWHWKNQFIREYEDFKFIAEAVAKDLARQNIHYAETFFSPGDFARHGLKPQEIAVAIRAGLLRVPEIKINLVADLVRDTGPDRAALTLAEINEVRGLGVIGVGIGGAEHDYPPELFEAVFEKARGFGFHASAHAGEAAGPESIWGALKCLQVERIGHGVRAVEDKNLMDFLAESKTPLEVCPISNVCTGVVNSMAKHPVRRLYEHGLVVTINTDDPKMFGNSLAQEYAALVDVLGFTIAEIKNIILQGIRSSWLTPTEKEKLIKEFQNHPDW